MSFNFCASGAIVDKAGANVNQGAATSFTLLARFCDQAEATLEAATRLNLISSSFTMTASGRNFLGDLVSAKAGNELIKWDMSGYTFGQEATTMLNVNDNVFNQGVALLKDKDVSRFLGISA